MQRNLFTYVGLCQREYSWRSNKSWIVSKKNDWSKCNDLIQIANYNYTKKRNVPSFVEKQR